ncbi:uncharacterized protein [Parasteatoda tepidariorum]|uniref:uncharacterized protein isoform X1 n=1 Tax=Parasteatoda tepidariorum TaxID=114398 RepID=UPI00077F94AF|nr:uncharacterized protein LOC107444955 isoform X2 [Parasteatoda tepidariorum]
MCSCRYLFQGNSKTAKLFLGILGVFVCFLRARTLILLILMMSASGEARPLGNVESTLPPAKARSLQSIIDEILSTTNSSDISMHHDIYRRSLERWSNPCELPGFIFDDSYMEGVPHADPVETATRILQATRSARGPAQKLLYDYGVKIFRDPNYIRYFNPDRGWLPVAEKTEVQGMSLRRAIKYFSDKLPFYGIALTQVTLDQVIHSGPFVEETREVEIILTQDVCQLQLGGLSLGVRPSKTEISDAMSKDYKDVKSKSQRDLRDIIILKEYNDFLKVMEDTFEHLVERTLHRYTTTDDVLNAASIH